MRNKTLNSKINKLFSLIKVEDVYRKCSDKISFSNGYED
jgi:hypothetical protein